MSTQPEFIDFDPDEMPARLCPVTGIATGVGMFKRQLSAGRGRFGHVEVRLGPHPGIHGLRFMWPQSVDAMLPLSYMREACFAGAKRALNEPLNDGRQVICVEVAVVDGSYHEHDTDGASMETAAYLAVRDALTRVRLGEV
jgi:translation elongation factor EF-G